MDVATVFDIFTICDLFLKKVVIRILVKIQTSLAGNINFQSILCKIG